MPFPFLDMLAKMGFITYEETRWRKRVTPGCKVFLGNDGVKVVA